MSPTVICKTPTTDGLDVLHRLVAFPAQRHQRLQTSGRARVLHHPEIVEEVPNRNHSVSGSIDSSRLWVKEWGFRKVVNVWC
jgi:hypothetical protein